jgi:DNA-binding winged helix-turn-helix (wHTH) protein
MRCTFDDFELDQEERRLLRGSVEIPVEPKALDLLCYLVAHPGRVIRKDELLERVWHAQALGDGVLSNTVAKLRKALGQSSAAGKPIETLHGRGYRFHAEVRVVAPVLSDQAAEPSAGARDPFVGRAGVMQLLAAGLEQARCGRGQLVLLTGDAGIGKSRLLRELSREARARGFTVWEGATYADGAAPAYWPWVEILRAARASSPGSWRTHVPKDSWALAQLVPELLGSAARVSDAHALRFRLFDELTRFVSSAAAELPRLIAIEDLHWADPASIELLAHLVRALERAPVLLLATVREHAGAADDAQAAALQRLSRSATHVALRGLALDEVAALLTQLGAGDAPEPGCAELVYERTQGNPFFVRQLLLLFVQRGQRLERQSLKSSELPPAVRDVIHQRLLALPNATRTLLAAAAVIGQSFDATRLAQLLDSELESVLPRLEPALRIGIVTRSELAAHRFGFAHALLRDSLYDELTLLERGMLHSKLAQLLAAQPGIHDARRLGEIAHHSLLAVPSELDACLVHCQRAAEAARDASSFEVAVEFLSRALDKLAAEGGEGRARCELLRRLGLAQFCAGALHAGWQSLEQGARLAQQLAASDLLAHFACSQADWLLVGGNQTDVHALIDLALARQECDEHQHPGLRSVLLARKAELGVERPAAERNQLFEQAESLARQVEDPRVQLEVAIARVGVRNPAQLAESLRAVEAYRALTLQHPGVVDGMQARLRLCSLEITEYLCALIAADLAAAERAFQRFQAAVDAARALPMNHAFEVIVAGRALAEGRLDDLAASVERLRAGANLGGGLGMVHTYYTALAAEARGEPPALELGALPAQPAALAGLSPAQFRAAIVWFSRASALAGQHELARAVLCQLPDEARMRMPSQWGDLGLLCSLAETYCELGDRPQAEALYAQLEPHAARNAVSLAFDYAGSVAHYLGMLALLLGRRSQAVAHLQLASRVNGELRMPLQLARTHELLARASQQS